MNNINKNNELIIMILIMILIILMILIYNNWSFSLQLISASLIKHNYSIFRIYILSIRIFKLFYLKFWWIYIVIIKCIPFTYLLHKNVAKPMSLKSSLSISPNKSFKVIFHARIIISSILVVRYETII